MSTAQVVPEYDVSFITSTNDTPRVPSITDTTLSSSTVENRKGSSWYAAVFLIINAALGAGLLNFPQAFDRAGGITVALSVQAVSDVTNIHVAVFVTN